MRIFTKVLLISIIFISVSCGSYKPRFLNTEDENVYLHVEDSLLEQRFYLLGDAGLGASENEALQAFKEHVKDRNTKNDWVVYLGDNIYPNGLPDEGKKGHDDAMSQIKAQTDIKKFFKGQILFIPGNHDWYSEGLKGLKRQEKFVEDDLDDDEAFQPENGCAIETIEVSDNVVMLAIDSQWYITDWDKHPTINDECDIKTREDFFLELEGELKKYGEKSIVIAIHHPTYTYGLHGGIYNFQKHIFAADNNIPLPIIASLVTLIRAQGGVSPQDRYNNRYNELMKRIITLTKDNDKVVFVSGHEHNLQYINNDGIRQIVSGAGSKESPVGLGKGSLFAYGGRGFAELDILNNGSSVARFYKAENGKPERLFETLVREKDEPFDVSGLPNSFPTEIEASIYEEEATDVTGSYEWFWGDHYRRYYGLKVRVPVATLDTLMGGMTIERGGGGHQTRSLRLLDPKERNFAMRAVKKSAVQFLQTVAFKETFVQDDFDGTLTEETIMDFYTSSHPFGAFVIGPLSDAIDLYHTNPQLLYMPKHTALGDYNRDFGDELYILEERPDDGFLDVRSFGNPDAIESTFDVLENLRKDEEYKMDEGRFIRARLFDMLVGDWDRHYDQWRWARFDHLEEGKKIYRPIPRDRDQVFSNYDGAILNALKFMIPSSKQFQEFGPELKDIKWINLAGIKIDRTFTQTSTREVWTSEAKYIMEHLTDEVIDDAFKNFPSEVQDETAEEIKKNLKLRRETLLSIANRYYDYLNDLVIITGTDKDDEIRISSNGYETNISIARIKDGKAEKPFKERIVRHKETKEIWVYGLDDDDKIFAEGQGRDQPKIKIIGGQNNDVYTITEGRKIKVFDQASKPNTIESKGRAEFKFLDNYRYNNYRYNKYIDKNSSFLPSVGYNPDDGMKVGLKYTTAKRGFTDDPYQSKHALDAGYFFATDGYQIHYRGEFSTLFNTWKILGQAIFTSDNYTQNFFGLGNESQNNDDELGLDYNRVRSGTQRLLVGALKRGHYGSLIETLLGWESIEIQNNQDRFINEYFSSNDITDVRDYFAFAEANYGYEGYDFKVAPTRGMFFNVSGGVRTNLKNTENTYGYFKYSWEFFNALTRSRKLVLNTKVQGQINIGDAFEFYQAANLGANNGLRGFRNQRFSGERSFAFKGDLRYHLLKFKTGLLPLKLGVFGGGDVGRVWLDEDYSERWHNDYGGGFWVNAVDSMAGNFSLFHSVDGLRFSFQFSVSF